MTGFEVYDMSSIPATVMKLKLINTEEPSLFFRLDKLRSIVGCINTLETFLIDLLDSIFVEACDICDILIGVCSVGEQITNVLKQSLGDPMAGCLE